ncbi:MAG: HlyC/CorC family transporter [Actinobacteria bacterium]|jgi:CBS domain containing-hemolysin-like protein|nr:HlyC/CorC family transporter [Actinomycetota bacterium]MBT3687503.1 HlyC/CorC family transporter [Actinomycetota bacterium]MBT4038201.1 HlyC/CorC family transporter [Actinomycetota bacterium]MBT4279092.1 HlyC/CorC family transporter [Actinomycetota bacterium]MBT4344273.1 HlyC/CorC family transporter [Actinomycetota bacterium]
MGVTEVVGLVLLVVATGCSAVLVAAETSIVHIGRARAEVIGDGLGDDDRVEALLALLDRRSEALRPLVLALVLCRTATVALVVSWAYQRPGAGWVVPSVAVLGLVVFVVAEALPRSVALRRTDTVALRSVGVVGRLASVVPLRWLATLLATISDRLLPRSAREVGPDVTEEELLAVADRALATRSIDEEEHELIGSVIAFGDTLVREVMVPRPDIVGVENGCTVQTALEEAVSGGHSRIPVSGTGIDDIVGVVHVKDLARAHLDGRSDEPAVHMSRPPTFIPETMKADDLLRQMQSERFHLAVVVDEYGGTAGLVTMEDLLEEVVGEIVDEFDLEEPLSQPLAGGDLRVHGRMPVDELNDLLGENLPDGDWDTVGGLIFNALGHVPEVGEAVEFSGRRFCIEQVVGRRITRIRVGAPEVSR